MLGLLLALHAAGAAVAPFALRRFGARAFVALALVPLATLVALAARAGGVLDGQPLSQDLPWVPDLGIALDLRLDALSLLLAVLISGVGALVFLYSAWYFGSPPGLGRLAPTLLLFAGSMLGVVLADNLLALYVFWELTSLTSFFLIGWEHTNERARGAAGQAMVVTVSGGLAMLAGFVILGQQAGTFRISELVVDPPSGGATAAALALILAGALTKSAQVPFHFWLPAAMEAPTPVSAYLHSATMVKAGIYLVARLSPVADGVGFWVPAVVTVGAVTMLVGGYRALREHDLKLLLAYGTVSQLGFMLLLVGGGFGDAALAGAALILAHGLFKAALFLVVGIVDHEAHTRDIRELPPLARKMPVLFAAAVVAAVSMAGVPPLFGFIAKELALDAWLHAPDGWGGAATVTVIVIGSVLTFAYSARFVWGGFLSGPESAEAGHDVHRPATAFVVAPVVLSVATIVFGLAPVGVEELVTGAAAAIEPDLHEPHLVLWPGLKPALALSAVAIAAGAVLFGMRRRVEAGQERLAWMPSAGRAYASAIAGLDRVAARTTGVVQNGSLPVYLGVILTAAVAVPAVPLLTDLRLPDGATIVHSPLQALVLALVAVTVIAAARAHNRFVAVLLLGGTGYGVAALFVIQGAPDLALTQVLVETVAVVMFVLVLRHLPARFERHRWHLGQGLRVAVAVVVGLFVATFSVVAAASRTAPPVSEEHLRLALPEAAGRNVVNVILVDFRAFDTLGEITVLTVAALGIVSLVRSGRRRSR